MSKNLNSSFYVKSSDTEDESSEDDDLFATMGLKSAAPKQKSKAVAKPATQPESKYDLFKLGALVKKNQEVRAAFQSADKHFEEAEKDLGEDECDVKMEHDDGLVEAIAKTKESQADSYGDSKEWTFFGRGLGRDYGEAYKSYGSSRLEGHPLWLQAFDDDENIQEQMLISGFASDMAAFDRDTPLQLALVSQDKSTSTEDEDRSYAFSRIFTNLVPKAAGNLVESDIKHVLSNIADSKDAMDTNTPISPRENPSECTDSLRYNNWWFERITISEIAAMSETCIEGNDYTALLYCMSTLLRALLDHRAQKSAILLNEIRELISTVIRVFPDAGWDVHRQLIVSSFVNCMLDRLYHTQAIVHFPVTSPRAYQLRSALASALLFHPSPPVSLTPAMIRNLVVNETKSSNVEMDVSALQDLKARFILVDIILDDSSFKNRDERKELIAAVMEIHNRLKDKPGSHILKTEIKDIADRIRLRMTYLGKEISKKPKTLKEYTKKS